MTTTKKMTDAERRYSEIAAEVWDCPATTRYGYPRVQHVNNSHEAPRYSAFPPGGSYGVSGGDDKWQVVFAEDGYPVDEDATSLRDALLAARVMNDNT